MREWERKRRARIEKKRREGGLIQRETKINEKIDVNKME